MNCPYCGSDVLDYLGVDDGGGVLGNAVCEQWECLECGAAIENNCFEGEILDAWDVDVYSNKDISDDLGEPF